MPCSEGSGVLGAAPRLQAHQVSRAVGGSLAQPAYAHSHPGLDFPASPVQGVGRSGEGRGRWSQVANRTRSIGRIHRVVKGTGFLSPFSCSWES